MLNADLGSDPTFEDLLNKIEGFNYASCALTDLQKLTRACKLLADETVRRHRALQQKELELTQKVSISQILSNIDEVIATTQSEKRKSFWRR